MSFLATEPYAVVRDRIEAARGTVRGDMKLNNRGGGAMAVAYTPPLVEIAVVLRFEEEGPMVPSKAAINPLGVDYVCAYPD